MRRRALRRLIVLSAVLVVSWSALVYRFEDAADVPALRDELPVQPGDLIFVRRPSLWSEIAVQFSPNDRRFSHVGIFVRDRGQAYVVHAAGSPTDPTGSVRKEALSEFLGDTSTIGVFRLRLSAESVAGMIERALEISAQAYKFNSSFVLGQEKAFYCTELIWKILNDVAKIDIVPVKRTYLSQTYIGLDDLTRSDFVREIQVVDLKGPSGAR